MVPYGWAPHYPPAGVHYYERSASPPGYYPAGASPPLPTGFISVPIHATRGPDSGQPGSPPGGMAGPHMMLGASPPHHHHHYGGGASPPMPGSPPGMGGMLYMPAPHLGAYGHHQGGGGQYHHQGGMQYHHPMQQAQRSGELVQGMSGLSMAPQVGSVGAAGSSLTLNDAGLTANEARHGYVWQGAQQPTNPLASSSSLPSPSLPSLPRAPPRGRPASRRAPAPASRAATGRAAPTTPPPLPLAWRRPRAPASSSRRLRARRS